MLFSFKYLKSPLIINAFAFQLLFTSNFAVAQNIIVPDYTLGNESSRVESLVQSMLFPPEPREGLTCSTVFGNLTSMQEKECIFLHLIQR